MPRNLVLFDLEWNIGYQPYTFNYHGVQQTLRGEIVEIGAVKIDEDANVLDTFSIHLRPRTPASPRVWTAWSCSSRARTASGRSSRSR